LAICTKLSVETSKDVYFFLVEIPGTCRGDVHVHLLSGDRIQTNHHLMQTQYLQGKNMSGIFL